MNKALLSICIIILLFCVFSDKQENSDKIRAELVAKGLPTPAFATTAELKNILKNY